MENHPLSSYLGIKLTEIDTFEIKLIEIDTDDIAWSLAGKNTIITRFTPFGK